MDLVNAIQNRYNDDGDTFSSCRISESSDSGVSLSLSLSESQITLVLPKRTRKSHRLTNIVINDITVSLAGDEQKLHEMCGNLLELDLARCNFNSWDEIKKILSALKKLKFLNLQMNTGLKIPQSAGDIPFNLKQYELDSTDINGQESPDLEAVFMEEQIAPESDSSGIGQSETEFHGADAYFDYKWSDQQFESLNTLILNSCFIDMKTVECLVQKLPCLQELHLSSNSYSEVNFSTDFSKKSLKTFYFCSNDLCDWKEVAKLGKNFPELESLVISQNRLGDLNSTLDKKQLACVFPHLSCLNLNGLSISSWDTIYQLRSLPALKKLRIKDTPLTDQYDKDAKFFLLLSYLNEDLIESLNGSVINKEEIDRCHRKFIGYYDDKTEKPQRFFEIKTRFQNKLNELLNKKRNVGNSAEKNVKQIGKANKNTKKATLPRKSLQNRVMFQGNSHINTLKNSSNKKIFSMWIPAD